MVRTRRGWFVALVIGTLAAVGVACGGGTSGTSGEPAQVSGADAPRSVGPQTGPAQATSAIPAVTVLDVPSGDEFALGSLVPSDRPVLVWFWAPH